MGDFNGGLNGVSGVDDSERVHEWEEGLPNLDDLTPLSQGLIPRGLLSAFNITPEPYRTSGDVNQASEKTLSSLRRTKFHNVAEIEVDDDDGDVDDMSESKKPRRNVSPEDADSAAAAEKRVRLVWTPQLHKRFVEVVAHLGIKNAVPKTIMQLMNVEGLTRENVASHLQKYRLYLKRNQGINYETGPSNSSAAAGSAAPVPVPVPMMTHQNHQQNSNYHYNYHQNNVNQHHNYQFSNGVMQTGNHNNMYGSVVSYHHNHPNHNYAPHVAPGEK